MRLIDKIIAPYVMTIQNALNNEAYALMYHNGINHIPDVDAIE
jgi:hypothetical protein